MVEEQPELELPKGSNKKKKKEDASIRKGQQKKKKSPPPASFPHCWLVARF